MENPTDAGAISRSVEQQPEVPDPEHGEPAEEPTP